MKTLTLLLLCSLSAMQSCTNSSDNYIILSKEYTDKECICKYYYSAPFKIEYISFEDSCNKYEIRNSIK